MMMQENETETIIIETVDDFLRHFGSPDFKPLSGSNSTILNIGVGDQIWIKRIEDDTM